MKKIPQNSRQLNVQLFDALPRGLNRVLEFGCSTGMLGKAYKSMNSGTIWHGVDINADAVKQAKTNIDEVVVANANDFEPSGVLVDEPYDAIIYGGVIEYLIDPVKSMSSHLKLLRVGGEFIACIPNIQHWTVVKDLLQGNWDYRHAGLMNNTNQRFFTLKSILKLLIELELTFVEKKRISYENQAFSKREDEKNEILNVLRLANQAIGLEFSEYDFRTYQYVIRAKKD